MEDEMMAEKPKRFFEIPLSALRSRPSVSERKAEDDPLPNFLEHNDELYWSLETSIAITNATKYISITPLQAFNMFIMPAIDAKGPTCTLINYHALGRR
jgi:hypothetical protein